jgi:hypothetical protein
MTVTVNSASQRLFARHVRHAPFDRLRYSQQELAFLERQANRLSSTVAIVYGKLSKYTAEQIAGATNLAAIP